MLFNIQSTSFVPESQWLYFTGWKIEHDVLSNCGKKFFLLRWHLLNAIQMGGGLTDCLVVHWLLTAASGWESILCWWGSKKIRIGSKSLKTFSVIRCFESLLTRLVSSQASPIEIHEKVAGGALFELVGQRVAASLSFRIDYLRVNLAPLSGALSTARWTLLVLFHLENFVLTLIETCMINLFGFTMRHLFEPGVGKYNIPKDRRVTLHSIRRLSLEFKLKGAQTKLFLHLVLIWMRE